MYRVTIPLLIALLWPQLFTLIYLITITYVCYLRYFLILLFYIAENNNKIMWNFICFIIDDNYLILHDNYLILHELCSVSRYCFKRISYNIKSFELILTWLKLPCLFVYNGFLGALVKILLSFDRTSIWTNHHDERKKQWLIEDFVERKWRRWKQ
jgi:hypothetical protein